MKGGERTNPSHKGGLHRADTDLAPPKQGVINADSMQTGVINERGEALADFDLNIAYANAY